MWTTGVKNWAIDVENWATGQGSVPNLEHLLSRIRASLGMLRFAQDCPATSSGSLSHCSVLNLVHVCSGSKAEIEFGEASFPLRVWWYYASSYFSST
jgi:hypothetical protein